MCGINGIFAYRPAAPAPQQRELLATREAMRARGPDGAGAWWSVDRRCAMGHRRLSIIDLDARADQPMTSEDGRFTIVYNGEVYNFAQLRADLNAKEARFRTSSDTEVILNLFALEGERAVERLRGMYAFAIWDALERRLFLARDPYGIKPLYVSAESGTFRFASQVKALLAGGAVSRASEPAGIVGFHLFGSVPEPFTLYHAIRALPAGHYQWVDAEGPRPPVPFANLAATLASGSARPAPHEELRRLVRDAVLDSVRAHVVADVEVGAFLSAGVDSGALLGLMRDAGQRQVRAITLAFEQYRGTANDEAPLAAEVAARYGARHIVRTVREEEFSRDLPAILSAMDQPSIDGVNTWFVSKAACEAGLKVAISGLGGDELLAGYPSFTDMPQWRRRFGLLAALPGLGALSRAVLSTFAPGLVRARPKAMDMLDYAGSWPGAYLLRRGLFLPRELPSLLEPELVREGLAALDPLAKLAGTLTPDPGPAVAKVCALESANYMRNQLLRDADWAGMAHSLEIRVPLVDFMLLERLAPSIGGLAPGDGKAALAAAPSRPLPEAVVKRAKTGFGVPTEAWMAAMAADRPRSCDLAVPMGPVARRWSRLVLERFAPATTVAEAA